jgi:hypothetical protein
MDLDENAPPACAVPGINEADAMLPFCPAGGNPKRRTLFGLDPSRRRRILAAARAYTDERHFLAITLTPLASVTVDCIPDWIRFFCGLPRILAARRWFKSTVQIVLRSVEVAWMGEAGYLPHLHCLAEINPHTTSAQLGVIQARIGTAYGLDILAETAWDPIGWVGYCTKGNGRGLSSIPSKDSAQLRQGLRGFRLVETLGGLAQALRGGTHD